MSTAGPLETLARLVGEALAPLEHRLRRDGVESILDELGLRLPAGALDAAGVAQGLQASAGACAQLPPAVAALVAAVQAGDVAATVGAAATLGQRIAGAAGAFTGLGIALDAAVQGAVGLTPNQISRLSAEAQALPRRLVHLAVVSYLDERRPALKSGLALAGVVDDIPVPAAGADPTLAPHRLRELRADRLATLVSDPRALLRDLYGFGRPDFDGLRLFARLKDLLDRPDGEAQLITAPGLPPALEAYLFRLALTADALPELRVRLRDAAQKDVDVSTPLGGPWTATARAQARFAGGLEVVLSPDGGVRLGPPLAAATLSVVLGVRAARADGTPMILLGQAGGSRLELQELAARLPLQLSASAGSPSAQLALGAEVELQGGKLVIDASQADGFVATLLGGMRIESSFDLGALYDAARGLRFTGSATVEIAIPAHIQLGPLAIPTIYLIAGFRDGTVPVEFSADVAADLGPLHVAVSRLGAVATVSFPPAGGNAGIAQIDVAFKAPNGVGLSIDAGVVRGGGYLSSDPARGEYTGAVELTFAGFLSLKAVGIITTRMPDGSQGFSLLLIVTADFGAGLQLGYGFTLLAVGGLLGLNRTMRLDALVEGVRTGSLASAMFPRDIVANAPRIISDLRTFFPPRQGTFLVGPMAKLGWGTPTLVSLSVGVIVEIPGNAALVGLLRVALPAEEVAVVVLQVSFIGAIEFDRSRGWFFASLFDSRVLFITINGEMGLLIGFGADADFVLAVGGFHPRYTPPPLPFPAPRRISIDILNTAVARLRAEGYFATTSNSVQFGCQAEAFFGFSALNVSGHIQFDALIRFSPFTFVVSFSAHFEVRVFGVGVWGLRIRLEVEGPTPWHAHGSAGISLLFFDIDVDIETTWGERRDTSLPPVAVLPRLAEELGKADSWRALPPSGANLLVSLRKLPDAQAGLALHPVGTLRVSQRFAPLDAKLDRVGAQRPADGHRFALFATAGSTFVQSAVAEELFAPAQFEDLSDDERLSRKAFEPRHAGVELSAAGGAHESGAAVARVNRYDLITVDTNARRHRRPFARLGAVLFGHLLTGAAASRCDLSVRSRKAKVPVADGVRGLAEGFAVALQDDNRAAAPDSVRFASEGAARQWLADAVAADRTKADRLHVVPVFELADA